MNRALVMFGAAAAAAAYALHFFFVLVARWMGGLRMQPAGSSVSPVAAPSASTAGLTGCRFTWRSGPFLLQGGGRRPYSYFLRCSLEPIELS